MNVLLTLLALTPLAFTGAGFFSYTSDKSLFIRFIVSLVSVWFFCRLIRDLLFRDKIMTRLRLLGGNPIFLCVCVYSFFFILSAVFAVDRFSAFFGTVERGEGVVGMLFFFGFFLFAVLLLQKKEWIWFFKMTLITSSILFVHAVIQGMAGLDRPYSFAGNSNFLSAYFLFPLIASVIVFLDSREFKNVFWRVAAPVVGTMSFLGVVLTNSRGVIVGMAVGMLSALGYAAFSADVRRRDVEVQKWSRLLLVIVVLFFGVFVMTKQSAVWQRVPVLGRLAEVSLSHPAATGRFYLSQVAMLAMDPVKNGYKKIFFGWGPENFVIAAHTYYDPHQYFQYEYGLDDRVYNKVLDVFVATGMFGLLSYVAIWFSVFRFLLFGRCDSLSHSDGNGFLVRSILLFFGMAYFVQNLFAFDNMTTYIPFFAFLAFLVFLAAPSQNGA